MGGRLFAAIRPTHDVVEDLERFVGPRRDADPRVRWIDNQTWHLTMMFAADVSELAQDQLRERLADVASSTQPFGVVLDGAGCFPNPFQARVLYIGAAAGTRELAHLAKRCRNAANAAGAAPDGSRFVPHLTLARIPRPFDATRWMQIVNSFGEFSFDATGLELVQSHLGDGPGGTARHEVLERFDFHGTNSP